MRRKKHADLYKAAWGREYMRPKHHYMLHLPGMYENLGGLISCLVHERKHRTLKKYPCCCRTISACMCACAVRPTPCVQANGHSVFCLSFAFQGLETTEAEKRSGENEKHCNENCKKATNVDVIQDLGIRAVRETIENLLFGNGKICDMDR